MEISAVVWCNFDIQHNSSIHAEVMESGCLYEIYTVRIYWSEKSKLDFEYSVGLCICGEI